jgi:hypothetical protein
MDLLQLLNDRDHQESGRVYYIHGEASRSQVEFTIFRERPPGVR